jgi:ABC-type transport system substrate-binding protein
VPSLATEWTANEDLTEWTFTLRDGVKFHNGATLDANDVVLSYGVQWDARTRSTSGIRAVQLLLVALRRPAERAGRGVNDKSRIARILMNCSRSFVSIRQNSCNS